jgi:hypothetical protein
MTLCGLLRMDGGPARRSVLTAMLATSSTGLPSARGVHVDGPFGVAAAAETPDAVPPIAVDSSGLTVVLGGRLHGGRYAYDSGPFRDSRRFQDGPRFQDDGRFQDSQRFQRGQRFREGRRFGEGPPSAPLLRIGHPAGSAGRRGRHPRALAGADGTDACVFLAAYRDDPARRLDLLGGGWLALVWEPGPRRLVCARASGSSSRDLLTWTDGRTLVFGTEVAQLVAAGMPAPARPSRRPPAMDRPVAGRPVPARARLSAIRVLRAGERLTIRLRD